MKPSICGVTAAALLLIVDVVAAPLQLESTSIPLSEENPAIKIVGKLEYRGGLRLRSKDENFGGLSGLAISPDGSVLRAVTDKGNSTPVKAGGCWSKTMPAARHSIEYLDDGLYFVIRPRLESGRQCFDVLGGSVVDGAKIVRHPYHRHYNQQWSA